MNGRKWSAILKLTQDVSAFFSFTINPFLIFLILTKSPKSLGPYKYLMIFISAFEIVYSVLDMVLVPQHYAHGSAFLVLVKSDTPLGEKALNILNALYWGFYGASMAMFAVHFVYRWFVVSENMLLATFNDWRIVLWFCIPLAYGTIWVFTGYVLCAPSDATTRFIRPHIKELFGMEYGEYYYLGPYIYDRLETGTFQLQVLPLIGMAVMSTTISSSIVVVLVFGYLCYQRISTLVQTSAASAQFKKLQTQLFYALVIQTLIPFVLMHIPGVILLSFVFLDVDLGICSAVLSMTIAIYPAADPLPTIFIVESYRRTVLQMFGCSGRRARGTSTVSQVNSSKL